MLKGLWRLVVTSLFKVNLGDPACTEERKHRKFGENQSKSGVKVDL